VQIQSTDGNKADVVDVSASNVTGRVTFGVRGQNWTAGQPDPDLHATFAGLVCASTSVRVVIPSTQTHNVGTATITNSTVPIPGTGLHEPETTLEASVTIAISDQHGQVLDSVYDGDGVVTEQFSSQTGWFANNYPHNTNREITIVVPPPGHLGNGLITDLMTYFYRITTPAYNLNAAQAAAWVGFQQTIGGRSQAFGVLDALGLLGDFQGTARQRIRVRGHVVTPDFDRVMNALGFNYIPGGAVPFTATDTAVP
jgi:hypothetical protein